MNVFKKYLKNYQFMIDDYKKDCSGKIIMEKLLNKISVSLTNIDNQDKVNI